MKSSEYNWTLGYHSLFDKRGNIERIFEVDGDGYMVCQLIIQGSRPRFTIYAMQMKNYGMSYHNHNFKPSTQEEINWIKVCKQKGQYMDKREAFKDIGKELSVSEQHVESGEIKLGSIYWHPEVESYCIPRKTSDDEGFSGEFFQECIAWGYDNCENAFDLRNVEEITPEHADFPWISHCFKNKTYISKEEFENMNTKEGSTKFEVGKVYKTPSESRIIYAADDGYTAKGEGLIFGYNYEENTKLILSDLSLEPEQEYWTACINAKEVLDKEEWEKSQYKYADVVYDFGRMDSDGYFKLDFDACIEDHKCLNSLQKGFQWKNTPQSYDFWYAINRTGHTKESIYYLEQMKSQYQDYLAAKSKPDPAQEELVIIPGEVYYLGRRNWIVRADQNGEFKNSSYVMSERDLYFSDAHVCGVEQITRKAYPDEIAHLEKCEKAGKFVPKDYIEPTLPWNQSKVAKETREFNGEDLDIDELLKVLQHSESSKRVHENSAEYWKYEHAQLVKGYNGLDANLAAKIQECESQKETFSNFVNETSQLELQVVTLEDEISEKNDRIEMLEKSVTMECERSKEWRDSYFTMEAGFNAVDAELAKYQQSKLRKLKKWLIG